MSANNFLSWFLDEGYVVIPKKVLGLMEPLGLGFEELGKIMYLLYCDNSIIDTRDDYALNAVKTLSLKEIVDWDVDTGKYSFSPLYALIEEKITGTEKTSLFKIDTPSEKGIMLEEISYSQMIKELEKKLGKFLSFKEKTEIQMVAQSYEWPLDLVQDMFLYHQTSLRKLYTFTFFAKMAFGAKVEDKESLALFLENLNYVSYKVTEIKRRLGQKSNPSEPEKEMYLKWINEWKLNHELVLYALEQTVSASNASFKYVDSILNNWRKEGVDSVQKAKENLEKRLDSASPEKKKRKNAKSRLYQKTRDLSDLEE